MNRNAAAVFYQLQEMAHIETELEGEWEESVANARCMEYARLIEELGEELDG